MPAKKELYFFNKLIVKKGKNYTSDRIEWYSSKFIPTIYDLIIQNALNIKRIKSLKTLNLNYKRYFFSGIKGEATASYAAMPEELINEIVTLNEKIKVIMLIRHPTYRAWSHAKKDLVRHHRKSLKDVTFQEFKDFYTRDYQLRCGRYSDIITKWSRFVPEDRFFIGNYDDLKNKPHDLLKRIFVFLEVSVRDNNINNYLAQKVINTTGIENIPEDHKKLLLELFEEEISKLTGKYNLEWK